MDVGLYLERIRYKGLHEPTLDTLRKLQRAHLLTVPFENLDIHLGNPIILSLPAFYEKIVRRDRGGFCYELNGLFGWLLEQLGFKVTLLSAQVFQHTQPGPEFDHLVLLVEMEEPWLVDVGFGDLCLDVLPFKTNEETAYDDGSFRFVQSGTEYVLQRKRTSGWQSQYAFSLTPRQLTDFGDMCRYQQTSPESHFTQKTVCSLATLEGRITLSNNRLITTSSEHREEHEVKTENEYRNLLKTHFGIELEKETRINQLMFPMQLKEAVI